MRQVLAAWFACLLILPPVFGKDSSAQTDDWERVKLVAPGRMISIVTVQGDMFDARLKEWKPEGLSVLRRRDRVQEIARADIRKLSFVAGMHPAKRAAWAGAIGAGIGFAVWGGLCAGASCDVSPALVGAVGAGLVGGISAGVAALIPRHRELVYEANSRVMAGVEKR